MTGLRRCRMCLKEEEEEDSDTEEAELDTEEVELAGVRFTRETLPARTLRCWGLGELTSFCLFNWATLGAGREGGKKRDGGREKDS